MRLKLSEVIPNGKNLEITVFCIAYLICSAVQKIVFDYYFLGFKNCYIKSERDLIFLAFF